MSTTDELRYDVVRIDREQQRTERSSVPLDDARAFVAGKFPRNFVWCVVGMTYVAMIPSVAGSPTPFQAKFVLRRSPIC